jgi:hypothetical protein
MESKILFTFKRLFNHQNPKMKKISVFIFLALFASACQTEKEEIITTVEEAVDPAVEVAAVEEAVTTLISALIEPTEENLKAISHPDLTYGHSSGTIEDQAAFMDALLSGRNDYKTYEASNQEVKVAGNTAWIRHIMDAEIVVPTETLNVHLNVLTTWIKVDGKWILFARQAVKV